MVLILRDCGVPPPERPAVLAGERIDVRRIVLDRYSRPGDRQELVGCDRQDVPDAIVIQVTLNEGRTVEMKRAFYKAVADGLHERVGLRREDVVINLIEVKKENWSFGNGEAQYAQAPGAAVVK